MILDEPQYPVLDRAPRLGKTVSYFRLSDYAWWAGLTAGSVAFGHMAGISVGLARQSRYCAGIMGATAGFMFAYQNASGRLMGLKCNDKEVEAAVGKAS